MKRISTMESMDIGVLDIDGETRAILMAGGLTTLEVILSKMPSQIEQQTKLTVKEIDELIKKASLAVLKHKPMTVFQLQRNCNHFRNMQRKLSFGCSVLDAFTKGGLIFHGITEITGESGSGKTQICLQISTNVQQRGEDGRLEGAVAYICTEDAFPIKRLHQMVSNNRESSSLEVKKVLDRVFVEHVNDVDMLFHVLKFKLPVLIDQQNIKLLVIDSVAALFRYEQDFSDARVKAEGLYSLGSILHLLNREHEMAVVCVNQVTDVVDDSGAGFAKCLAPSLGLAWSNMVTTRVMLTRMSTNLVGGSSSVQQRSNTTKQQLEKADCTVLRVHGLK